MWIYPRRQGCFNVKKIKVIHHISRIKNQKNHNHINQMQKKHWPNQNIFQNKNTPQTKKEKEVS